VLPAWHLASLVQYDELSHPVRTNGLRTMNTPRHSDESARGNALVWGLGTGTVGVGSGVLAAVHTVHSSLPATIALCVLSAISIVATIAVPIVKVRTGRSVESRQAEAQAGRMKTVNGEPGVILGIIEKVVTAKDATPEVRKQCLELLEKRLARSAATPPEQALSPLPPPRQLSGNSHQPGEATFPTVITGGKEFTGDSLNVLGLMGAFELAIP